MQFRLTRLQHERLKNMAESKGYQRIAQYIRDTIMEKDLLFEQKFNEIYNTILLLKKDKEKQQKTPLKDKYLI